jgi:hypothetical protein
LSAMLRTSASSFKRNLLITLWSYSIRNVPIKDFKLQKCENNYDINYMFETDLIYLILRRIHTLDTKFHEMRTRELRASGRRTYALIRRYDIIECNIWFGR